ncbi:hypothetical protein BH10BAC1_BH10BAC1_06410 [soil metagenome]
MKKIILLLVFLFSIGFTSAQVTFFKTITGLNESSDYVEQTTDGGYVIAGVSADTTNYNGLVIKTNSVGDTIWTKVYGNVAQFHSGKQTSDGGYILLGVIRNFIAGNDDMYILKIDSLGNIQWQNMIDAGSYEEGKCIKQTSDGGYIIVGNNYSLGLACIVKLDGSGNVLWNHILRRNIQLNSIEQTNSGGYVALGAQYVPATGSKSYLIKLDGLGTVLWSKIFSGSANDYGKSIVQTNDNGYMLLGATDTVNAMSIIKTDSTGNFLWGKSYKGAMGNYASSLKKVNNGNFIISSAFLTNPSDWNTKMLFTLIDSTGSELWSRFMGNDPYPGLMYSIGTYAAQTTDGGYIFTGSLKSPIETGYLYFIKADSMGRNGCNDTLISLIANTYTPAVNIPIDTLTSGLTFTTPTYFASTRSDTIITYCTSVGINELSSTSQISIYPNPSSGQFNFNGLEKGNKIEVFDMTGKIIYEGQASSDFETINISENAKGIYFYRITDESKLLGSGKICVK